MRKRLILSLFLLSSLGLIGCNVPTSIGAEEPSLDEELPDLTPELDEHLPSPSEADSPSLELVSEGPPDPLAEEPVEPTLLKGNRKQYYLFYYGYEACSPCRVGKPKVQAWASKKGLTQSESDAPNARMNTVQFIDIVKHKPKRDLSFDGDQALFPTMVWVDQSGRELWHSVGVPSEKELDLIWGLLEKSR